MSQNDWKNGGTIVPANVGSLKKYASDPQIVTCDIFTRTSSSPICGIFVFLILILNASSKKPSGFSYCLLLVFGPADSIILFRAPRGLRYWQVPLQKTVPAHSLLRVFVNITGIDQHIVNIIVLVNRFALCNLQCNINSLARDSLYILNTVAVEASRFLQTRAQRQSRQCQSPEPLFSFPAS